MNVAKEHGIGVAQEADDVCALPLVRRLAATLDLEPSRWREGDALPRGWHLALFTVDTPHSRVRADGLAGLGVKLPDVGLPRIVFGGRTIRFHGDIAIGAHLRRVSRLLSVTPKEGRSGRLAIAQIQHEIFVADAVKPAIIELQSYVMREAAAAQGDPAPAAAPRAAMPAPVKQRVVVPDEILLFRVSAVMFNPHRIHYDLPFAKDVERYPALVVNGSVSSLLLLEFYREQAGREPDFIGLRNVGLAFCGRPLRLNAIPGEDRWRMWADDEHGSVAVEGEIGTGLQ
ncbi:MAG TPA: hypothetical protein VNE58_03710 [Casimicrobiaceae bacterium]|nr:hypothetical protein [Casimicrobiaceae bacterium]